MVEIYKNLFVGNQNDYEMIVRGQENWAIVHACKEPYHRQELGYKGQGAPKEHPEYLLAKRGNRIILNLVDVDNPDWISPIIIDEALTFIQHNLDLGKKVLVHCNQGMSRSGGIGLLYLATQKFFEDKNIDNAEAEYKNIYPMYNPARGMKSYIHKNWDKYCK